MYHILSFINEIIPMIRGGGECFLHEAEKA